MRARSYVLIALVTGCGRMGFDMSASQVGDDEDAAVDAMPDVVLVPPSPYIECRGGQVVAFTFDQATPVYTLEARVRYPQVDTLLPGLNAVVKVLTGGDDFFPSARIAVSHTNPPPNYTLGIATVGTSSGISGNVYLDTEWRHVAWVVAPTATNLHGTFYIDGVRTLDLPDGPDLPWSDMTMGAVCENLEVDVDWVRISSSVRYPPTARFTPPGEPPAIDGDTLLQMSFDDGTIRDEANDQPIDTSQAPPVVTP